MLEGAKLYTQLGNAVNPLLVRAVGRSVLAALDGEGGLPRCPVAEPPSTSAGDVAPTADTARCESFLCPAAINLLRGVTPPITPPTATGGSSAAADKVPEEGAEAYGRYGHEPLEERARRVHNRPPARLFCMRCEEVYSCVGAVDVVDSRE